MDILCSKLNRSLSLFDPLVIIMGNMFWGGIIWSQENSTILSGGAPAFINSLFLNSVIGDMVPPATITDFAETRNLPIISNQPILNFTNLHLQYP